MFSCCKEVADSGLSHQSAHLSFGYFPLTRSSYPFLITLKSPWQKSSRSKERWTLWFPVHRFWPHHFCCFPYMSSHRHSVLYIPPQERTLVDWICSHDHKCETGSPNWTIKLPVYWEVIIFWLKSTGQHDSCSENPLASHFIRKGEETRCCLTFFGLISKNRDK